jgi:hypothetical protein
MFPKSFIKRKTAYPGLISGKPKRNLFKPVTDWFLKPAKKEFEKQVKKKVKGKGKGYFKKPKFKKIDVSKALKEDKKALKEDKKTIYY